MRAMIFCWSESDILPIEIKENDYVICADTGIDYALRCGVKPNIAIGDFDSFDKSKLVNLDFEIVMIKEEKDETDTHYAVMHALEHGYTEIIICGGIGGRLDHTLANISTLKYIYENGANGHITDGYTTIYFMPQESSINLPYHKNCEYISLWAMKDSENVNIKGLKYELDKATLKTDFSIGTSNEFLEGKDGLISIGKGEAVVILIMKNN